MTELLIFLLSLLGFDAVPAVDTATAMRNQQQKNIRTNSAASLAKTEKNRLSGSLSGSGNVLVGDVRGGGSRQIGGPVIVFDDVMFKPVGN